MTAFLIKYTHNSVKLDTCAFPCEGGYSDKRGKGQYVHNKGQVRADLPLYVCESVCIWLFAPVRLQKCAYA